MNKNFKVSSHAIQKYSIRTGISILDSYFLLMNDLAKAETVNLQKACSNFTISKVLKDDRYFMWYCDRISEYVLAIVRKDGTVATILTQQIFSSSRQRPHNKQLFYENGKLSKKNGWLVKEQYALN